MKILSVGGTRPQFVKMAVLVKAFTEYNRQNPSGVEHRLLHTGQHYDPLMSDIFFEELGLPQPETLAGICPGPPGRQTAAMLASIETSLMNWRPDVVLVYGDTNSTLAASLAAVKLHIPLVHLEAGLRSFNRRMQEEINRIVCDHVSDLLLCPTHTAVAQLATEGLRDKTRFVGDVMLDAVAQFATHERRSRILEELALESKEYALVTLHRAENTDDVKRLGDVMFAIERVCLPVILPVHPRLKDRLGDEGMRTLSRYSHIHLVDPVGYLEMLALEQRARMILTDSGGIQKEAYFLGVPCLTLRDETEWNETLHDGWNTLVGTRPAAILSSVNQLLSPGRQCTDKPIDRARFGDGLAGAHSVQQVIELLRVA
jgi:UDP-GlcNAc3NAcA epimerase